MSVSKVSHACHAKATSNAHCPTPATQKTRSPRDARAYIRPLHYPMPATQKTRSPRDARAFSRPLGWSHCSMPGMQKIRSPRDARANIRPLAAHIVPRLAPKKRGAQGTPGQGVHPTPWQCTLSHACHAKDAEPEGCQGIHPTPSLSHACHAKDAEPEGRQGV